MRVFSDQLGADLRPVTGLFTAQPGNCLPAHTRGARDTAVTLNLREQGWGLRRGAATGAPGSRLFIPSGTFSSPAGPGDSRGQSRRLPRAALGARLWPAAIAAPAGRKSRGRGAGRAPSARLGWAGPALPVSVCRCVRVSVGWRRAEAAAGGGAGRAAGPPALSL